MQRRQCICGAPLCGSQSSDEYGCRFAYFYDRFLPDGVRGTYVIEYFSRQGDAMSFHQCMKRDYPLIKDKKWIKSGYLSLSPVSQETSYLIYALIK